MSTDNSPEAMVRPVETEVPKKQFNTNQQEKQTMSVRAKFQVQSITHNAWGNAVSIKLSCMYDQTIPEDQRFYDATPSGSIEMLVNNPAAIEQFKLKKYFYVDFHEVPEAAPAT